MDNLTDIQLIKMSVEELDSLIDSLYNKYDGLKSTIGENVWVGNYGGVSSSLGIGATREIEDLKSYIKRVGDTLAAKEINLTKNSCVKNTNPPKKSKELYFYTYAEAKEWSKNNIGKSFTKSPDGSGFVPVEK